MAERRTLQVVSLEKMSAALSLLNAMIRQLELEEKPLTDAEKYDLKAAIERISRGVAPFFGQLANQKITQEQLFKVWEYCQEHYLDADFHDYSPTELEKRKSNQLLARYKNHVLAVLIGHPVDGSVHITDFLDHTEWEGHDSHSNDQ
jgi:hypothetical protein